MCIRDSLYGSDHFPIFLEMHHRGPNLITGRKYKFSKANWVKYQNIFTEHLGAFCTHEPENLKVNNKVEIITNLILNAANQGIRKTANNDTKTPVP